MSFKKVVLSFHRYQRLLQAMEKNKNATIEQSVKDGDDEIDANVPMIENESNAHPVKEEPHNHSVLALSSIHPKLKARAQMLLDFITSCEAFDWNERGELVYLSQTVHGSHITDLLRESLSVKSKDIRLTGADIFYSQLAKCNVPLSLIINPRRRQQISEIKNNKIGFHPPGVLAETSVQPESPETKTVEHSWKIWKS